LMRVIEEHVRSAVVTQSEQNLSMTKAFSWTKNDVGISRQQDQRGHRAVRTWRSLGNIGEKQEEHYVVSEAATLRRCTETRRELRYRGRGVVERKMDDKAVRERSRIYRN
jgi:hypothetical protein